MYNGWTVYGPYRRGEDKRKIVQVYLSKDTRKVMLYARYRLEIKLGRYLTEDEQVHHKDGNPLNDDIDNLELVLAKPHQSSHSKKYSDDIITKPCLRCGKDIGLTGAQWARRDSRKKAGPFCSRRCSGLYGKERQSGRTIKDTPL